MLALAEHLQRDERRAGRDALDLDIARRGGQLRAEPGHVVHRRALPGDRVGVGERLAARRGAGRAVAAEVLVVADHRPAAAHEVGISRVDAVGQERDLHPRSGVTERPRGPRPGRPRRGAGEREALRLKLRAGRAGPGRRGHDGPLRGGRRGRRRRGGGPGDGAVRDDRRHPGARREARERGRGHPRRDRVGQPVAVHAGRAEPREPRQVGSLRRPDLGKAPGRAGLARRPGRRVPEEDDDRRRGGGLPGRRWAGGTGRRAAAAAGPAAVAASVSARSPRRPPQAQQKSPVRCLASVMPPFAALAMSTVHAADYG